MNTMWKYALLFTTLAALVLGAWLVPASAEEDDDDGDDAQMTVEALAAQMAKVKIPLATAVTTAEKAAKGKAFEAELEVEDGAPLYSVYVFVPGTAPKLFEVEVDAVTGKVKEMEEKKGDEDDEDEGDDEDEDEDEDEDSD
jgi:uncharacterized membrane protein YkoI